MKLFHSIPNGYKKDELAYELGSLWSGHRRDLSILSPYRVRAKQRLEQIEDQFPNFYAYSDGLQADKTVAAANIFKALSWIKNPIFQICRNEVRVNSQGLTLVHQSSNISDLGIQELKQNKTFNVPEISLKHQFTLFLELVPFPILIGTPDYLYVWKYGCRSLEDEKFSNFPFKKTDYYKIPIEDLNYSQLQLLIENRKKPVFAPFSLVLPYQDQKSSDRDSLDPQSEPCRLFGQQVNQCFSNIYVAKKTNRPSLLASELQRFIFFLEDFLRRFHTSVGAPSDNQNSDNQNNQESLNCLKKLELIGDHNLEAVITCYKAFLLTWLAYSQTSHETANIFKNHAWDLIEREQMLPAPHKTTILDLISQTQLPSIWEANFENLAIHVWTDLKHLDIKFSDMLVV